MAEVETRGVEVVVEGRTLHRAVSEEAAGSFADWVRFQLAAGTSVEAIEGMMRGQHEVDDTPRPKPRKKRKASKADALDLTVLDGSIGDLTAVLASGDLDPHLDALLAAEESGKGRKGALGVIRSRIEEIA